MSAQRLRAAVVSPSVDDSDDLDHLYCCDPDWALCGLNLHDVPEVLVDFDGPDVCVVCHDLEFALCPRCGNDP